MFWDWQFVGQILPQLAQASVVTIFAAFLGFLIAALLGLAFALGRLFGPKWIAIPLIGLIEGIRSTPLLIQIFFIYFVLPEAGVSIGAMTAGVLALGLHYATYCSEVYRAGLANIPRGQWEASLALNLPTWRTFRDIIIPQAIPPVVPALGNYLVALFKDTPLLSAIGVLELLQTAKIIGSENFRYTEPITLVGLIFLILSLLSAVIIGFIERWLKRHVMRS
jgi:polar amino acid transport system permease protein